MLSDLDVMQFQYDIMRMQGSMEYGLIFCRFAGDTFQLISFKKKILQKKKIHFS
jgi:hypothetical protein